MFGPEVWKLLPVFFFFGGVNVSFFFKGILTLMGELFLQWITIRLSYSFSWNHLLSENLNPPTGCLISQGSLNLNPFSFWVENQANANSYGNFEEFPLRIGALFGLVLHHDPLVSQSPSISAWLGSAPVEVHTWIWCFHGTNWCGSDGSHQVTETGKKPTRIWHLILHLGSGCFPGRFLCVFCFLFFFGTSN